ncbi:hypothetical protein AV955_gp061 [Diadromus pulchellus ascovirus 4a]|uniref:Complete DpAV4 genome n=1 Tax=Diadromus pulchellus ascovirus 4a TaxID=158683 RepID=F2NYZ0_9VIRU|nr:hypothetical protein AV955_gp061 [Diadromus pulchellus ascovirus 4a]CCA61418.1 unnamed protein product [Diadromus pulchellus ascovirus 4a]
MSNSLSFDPEHDDIYIEPITPSPDMSPTRSPTRSPKAQQRPEPDPGNEVCVPEKKARKFYYDGVHSVDKDHLSFKVFYHLYRLKQRSSAVIWGIADGFMTGACIGGKWGGGGGLLVGSIAALGGITWCPIVGMVELGVFGLLTDRYSVAQLAKDYRYSMGAGGMPSIHGTLS